MRVTGGQTCRRRARGLASLHPVRVLLIVVMLLEVQACADSGLPAEPPRADHQMSPELTDRIFASTVGQVHAVASGDPKALAVLFLHGTPGSWRAFEDYLLDPDLTARLRLVAVDRPGWGASLLRGDAGVEPSFSRQSAALRPLLAALDEANEGRGVIVVGHSLGASIAPRVAADHAGQVKGLLLLAGSHSPELRARRWYNLLADWPPVRWIIGETLRRSNDEIMALPRELRRLADVWSGMKLPITVIQGMDDPLVTPAHADYVDEISGSGLTRVLRLPDTDHFIPWNRYELIRAELLRLADCVESAAACASMRRPPASG